VQIVDFVGLLLLAALVVFCGAVIARQRHMIRSPGAIPLATRRRGTHWSYGVGQYIGGELRWYRALGIGTRPSRVLRRGDVKILGHRAPSRLERGALPTASVIVDCRDSSGYLTIALSEGAFTGFVSWLEASAPAT
jgi:Protein of unknown function (DUF2550)